MQQIADWLKKLGMSEYAQRFVENDIDMAVLPDLTDQHVKDLGVSLGHRLKMLSTIRELGDASVAATVSSPPAATEPTRRDEAERRPLTIMFCDLPTTRESLDLLIDGVATLRVLVVITFRPEFAPQWAGSPHVTMLTLNRLPPRQRAEMIAYVTGGKTLPREIADQIVDRTDGVPLFIEELTKTVVESGALTDTGDRYAVTGPVAPLAIPTTLHESLLARLDRLAPTRELAQVGAALGRQFSHRLISAVARIPQPQLDNALEQLVRAELLFRRGTPPDAEYTRL